MSELDSLPVGPLLVPLVQEESGVSIDDDDDPWWRPLAWALDTLVLPESEGLCASVAAGEPVYFGAVEIRSLQPNDDLDQGRNAWREHSGVDLSEPVTVVRVDVDTTILPRAILLEVISSLADLRRR